MRMRPYKPYTFVFFMINSYCFPTPPRHDDDDDDDDDDVLHCGAGSA